MVYIVIHIVLCLAVFEGAKYVLKAGEEGNLFRLFDVVIACLKSNIVLMNVAVVLLTPFRLIGIRQSSPVTDFEVKGTMAVTVAGGVLSLIMGAICMGIGALGPVCGKDKRSVPDRFQIDDISRLVQINGGIHLPAVFDS